MGNTCSAVVKIKYNYVRHLKLCVKLFYNACVFIADH